MQVASPLNRIEAAIAGVTAGGANDGTPVCGIVTGYGQHARVQTAMGPCKAILGRCLRSRSFSDPQPEIAAGAAVLNRTLDKVHSDSDLRPSSLGSPATDLRSLGRCRLRPKSRWESRESSCVPSTHWRTSTPHPFAIVDQHRDRRYHARRVPTRPIGPNISPGCNQMVKRLLTILHFALFGVHFG
jgi:hypothetical protein